MFCLVLVVGYGNGYKESIITMNLVWVMVMWLRLGYRSENCWCRNVSRKMSRNGRFAQIRIFSQGSVARTYRFAGVQSDGRTYRFAGLQRAGRTCRFAQITGRILQIRQSCRF